MAGRHLHRLSAPRVAKAADPGHYADGGGLYLRIADSGARSWVFRFTLDGRVREMGLGPLSRVSLGEARKLAIGYRDMVGNQVDPILARREEQRRRQLDISIDANVTFREADLPTKSRIGPTRERPDTFTQTDMRRLDNARLAKPGRTIHFLKAHPATWPCPATDQQRVA
ncbi:Arm DNA-binding domain-containing protein [Burkholderia sp. AU45251]|uniref:Arm DNA-binding domain-containing protein n=1 Tax=Burkholderia sp. AU45251 TaxID=3059204 RepID=UPI002655B90A|nr:Arm DNA-binding domain-containing protein [Burkholderia sp. AU45251]MDN7520672.1 Arm DNA-binding domain-containing protein [Burkholderia sp. AU45251]